VRDQIKNIKLEETVLYNFSSSWRGKTVHSLIGVTQTEQTKTDRPPLTYN